MIAGVVLAGGRSSRLGSEKAVARIGPTPLVARAAEVLSNGCGAVAVNAPSDSRAAGWAQGHGLTVLPDREGGPRGPLAGVLAALDWGVELGVALVAVAPCDCPALPRDLVARMAASLAADAGAAAARSPDGLEPACALWRTSSRAAVEAALADGAHPALRDVLADVGANEVMFGDALAFADADTLAELKALGGRPVGRAWLRPAGAGALRLGGAVLLSAYALGGVVLAAVVAVAGDPRPGANRTDWTSLVESPAFDATVVAALVWLGLVVWAVPRLTAAGSRPPPRLRVSTGAKLTRRPTRRI